ncbi:hypothetical protein GCM10027185_59630 [Spirosoma pulveris]
MSIVKCKCGATVRYSISEGSNPGCKERETVDCPKCGAQLHSMVYNDATVLIDLLDADGNVIRPEGQPDYFF